MPKKKAYIFAETPTITRTRHQYLLDREENLPKNLKDIETTYLKKEKQASNLTSSLEFVEDYMLQYLKGYYGENNLPNISFSNVEEEFNKVANIKDKLKAKKIKDIFLAKNDELKSLNKELTDLEESFYNRKHNPTITTTEKDSTFVFEGNKLKDFYKKKGIEANVIPLYGLQDTTKINENYITPMDDVAIFGHAGFKYANIPNEWWNRKISELNPERCLLGSCHGDNRQKEFKDIKNLYRTTDKAWRGVNPFGNTIEDALFSIDPTPSTEKIIKPKEDIHYTIQNKDMNYKSQIPKYPFGAVIGAASLGLNVFNTIKGNRQARIADRTARNNRVSQLVQEDRQILDEYPTIGNEEVIGFYRKGGSIYINPSKKGTFKAQASRMKMGVQEAASTILNAPKGKYSPTMKKKANFAKNFAKPYGGRFMMYRNGGNMEGSMFTTRGGELIPLSNDMQEADGNTHNQTTIDNTSGIKLLNPNGQPIAEIEDGEVIKNDQLVFSDRLKTSSGRTYANEAKRLGRMKGMLEEELDSGMVTGVRRSTIMAKLNNIDNKENMLFEEQEMSKAYGGKMKYSYGGKMKKMQNGGFTVDPETGAPVPATTPTNATGNFNFNDTLPFLDNITNLLLTANTPRQSFPALARPRQLRTSFNVAPQLQEVTDTVNQITEGIQRGTASSGAAQQRTTATRLAGLREKNRIRAEQENIETQLENQNIAQQQQVEAQNLARIQNFRDRELQRSYNIQGRLAGNVADLVSDFNKEEQADATRNYLDEQLATIQETYNVNGTVERADLSVLARQVLAKDANGNYIYPDRARQFLNMYPNYR